MTRSMAERSRLMAERSNRAGAGQDGTAGRARARDCAPHASDTKQGGFTMRTWTTFTQRLSSGRGRRWGVASALTAGFALLLSASGSAAPNAAEDRLLGWRVK